MFPIIGSIFFPLKVSPGRIENNFKMHKIEKPPLKLNYINMSVFLNRQIFDAMFIKCFTVLKCINSREVSYWILSVLISTQYIFEQ